LKNTKRLHIVGRKNSGKTTLVSGLTAELSARGYHIATIKHTSHRHPIDTEGKDTWKHRRAGSIATVMLMPEEFAVFADRPEEDQLMAHLAPWLDEANLILVEGWSAAGGPCIEVRATADAEPVFPELGPDLLAFAADVEVPTERPCFSRDDIAGLADFIIAQLLD